MTAHDRRAVVVGAGVSGLTTAVRLAEAGWQVDVLTAEPPGVTASAAATGVVGPAFAEPMDKVPRWAAATIAEFEKLADEPATGVRRRRGLFTARTADQRPPPAFRELPGYREASDDELPDGFGLGFWLEIPVVDMTRYLPYLRARLEATGTTITMQRVGALDELTGDHPVVVNCAGVGARELAADPTVEPVWGMHAIVDRGEIETCFHEGPPGPSRWVGWVPHGDRLLIGGVAVPGREDASPEPDVAAELVAAAASVEPALEGRPVRAVNAGLRPGRPSIRVEAEPLGAATCIHNYGHGGQGVTLSWGCAAAVLELADAVVSR